MFVCVCVCVCVHVMYNVLFYVNYNIIHVGNVILYKENVMAGP